MKPCRPWNDNPLSRILRCSHAHSPFRCLSDDWACQYRRRALLAVGDVVCQRRLRQLIDHNHLDGVVFCHIVTNPDTLRTAFAPINRHIGRSVLEPFLPPHLFTIENGIGFRTILRAELAALGCTDFNVDIVYEVHGYSFTRWRWQLPQALPHASLLVPPNHGRRRSSTQPASRRRFSRSILPSS